MALTTFDNHIKQVAALIGSDKKAFIRTFGCQQNVADSERLAGIAVMLGYTMTDIAEDADLILMNTCAVREHAELRALSIAGSYKILKEERPGLLIGIFGCMMVQQHRVEDVKNRHPYVDFTFGTGMLHRLPEIIFNRLSTKKRQFVTGIGEDSSDSELPTLRENSKQAWVNVMHGCNNFCTFCIVPYVRGRERSRTKDSILTEVRDLVVQGYREITLLGQNVNSYKCGTTDFADLLEAVCAIEGDFVVRFMTSNPRDATTKLFDIMANSPRAAKALHLPLQAGSDSVLAAMNRKHTREEFLALVEYARRVMPEIVLTTDIIVGFPGETEGDFEQTLDMLRRVQFDSLFSFIYSKRKGTPAAAMDNQISREVKSARFSRLLDTQKEISTEINRKYIGQVVRALVEGQDKRGKMSARMDNGRIVHFNGSTGLVGQTVSIKIQRSGVYSLSGELQI